MLFCTAEVMEQLRNTEGCPESNDDVPQADGIRNKLWLLFEYPESSRTAFVIGIISVIMDIRVLQPPAGLFSASLIFLVDNNIAVSTHTLSPSS